MKDDRPKFYTMKEAAEIFRSEYKTIWKLVRSGKLPAGKIAGRWKIYEGDLMEFFRGCCKYSGREKRSKTDENG